MNPGNGDGDRRSVSSREATAPTWTKPLSYRDNAPATVGGVDTIVALQAVEESSDRRRKAVKTGDRILDLLDKLKLGLLSGQVSVGDLDALKTNIERQQNLESDPELNDVLKQIDLRACIELAKLKAARA